MKNKMLITATVLFLFPICQVAAASISNSYLLIGADCNYIFGSLGDPNSFATLLQDIFNVFKFAAPLCVLVFSTIDYLKSVANQNKEEVTKVTAKTAKRLIFAAILYFLPTVINFLFKLLGWTGTCGIE